MSQELTKVMVEERLMLGEFVAELYGKTFNESALKIFSLFRKRPYYMEDELIKTVGNESVQKSQEIGIIRGVRKIGYTKYELTDFGQRLGDHYHNICTDLFYRKKAPKGMSEDNFRKYQELAKKYNKFLKE